ncbi:FHA domain-containing protein [Entamoeba marina]
MDIIYRSRTVFEYKISMAEEPKQPTNEQQPHKESIGATSTLITSTDPVKPLMSLLPTTSTQPFSIPEAQHKGHPISNQPQLSLHQNQSTNQQTSSLGTLSLKQESLSHLSSLEKSLHAPEQNISGEKKVIPEKKENAPISISQKQSTSVKAEQENKKVEKGDEILLGQYKYCRFCEGQPYDTNVSYLPIINEKVGSFPIVLKLQQKCQSNYICLHHWRENRREYLEHYVQSEKSVVDESLVLLYASMIDKKINYSYVPSTNNIQEDTKASFSKYLALRRQQIEMAMGSVPAGLAVTSDLLSSACNSPTQQMFDLSLFPPSFVQFLAWQRLMQVYSKIDSGNINILNAMKKEALKESEKIVKDSIKIANENPSEARKRLQPDYVPEPPPQKKSVKPESSPLPPIKSSIAPQTQLPHIPMKSARPKSVPCFVNEQTKKILYTFTKNEIIIGRKGKDNTVDFDLSQHMDAKSVSHLHAIVKYEKENEKWVIIVKGRNGMKVDSVSKGKDTREVLKNGSIIETSNFQFSFHCPDDFNGQF